MFIQIWVALRKGGTKVWHDGLKINFLWMTHFKDVVPQQYILRGKRVKARHRATSARPTSGHIQWQPGIRRPEPAQCWPDVRLPVVAQSRATTGDSSTSGRRWWPNVGPQMTAWLQAPLVLAQCQATGGNPMLGRRWLPNIATASGSPVVATGDGPTSGRRCWPEVGPPPVPARWWFIGIE